MGERPMVPCDLRVDGGHVIDCDAWDAAELFVAMIDDGCRRPSRVALFLSHHGRLSVVFDPDDETVGASLMSLVGVYTPEATAQTVHDDILAMRLRKVDGP